VVLSAGASASLAVATNDRDCSNDVLMLFFVDEFKLRTHSQHEACDDV